MLLRETNSPASLRRLLLASSAALATGTVAAQVQNPLIEAGDPMAESVRTSISRVVLKPGESPTQEEISGSYEKQTYGLEGGMVAGGSMTTMNTQIGGVGVNVPIPVAQLPAMIAGGLFGATQKEIQDFRDAMTETLSEASSQQIINEKIAADVYNEIRTAPRLSPDVFARETAVPDGTDAVLYVSVKELLIMVDGDDAVITTTVNATMTRQSDETDIYKATVYYQDRDSLGDWTKNDNAAWKDYANFARHYVGREIAHLAFESAGVAQFMAPAESGDLKVSKDSSWEASSKKLSPTLAWNLDLPGSGDDPAWASEIDESDIFYELEIYDQHQPVYSASNIPDREHTVTTQLAACQDYRWSVRPVYHVNGDIRYGRWMRYGTNGNGNIGVNASELPAYIYDFAALEVRCNAK